MTNIGDSKWVGKASKTGKRKLRNKLHTVSLVNMVIGLLMVIAAMTLPALHKAHYVGLFYMLFGLLLIHVGLILLIIGFYIRKKKA